MKEGVRYQMYESSDGHVLFMASEQAFWKNFCESVGRPELFDRWPGSKFADHARGNRELQADLREIFKAKTSQEWIGLGDEKNFPIAPVNTPKTIADDPQFRDRFPLYSHQEHGADMLPFPLKLAEGDLPAPSVAPTVGQHNDQVLADLLGYDNDKIAELKKAGAFG
jgi:crotonobetainyl-CoA:carnitine CoA-transferase CaiB-like acyl-CoA transferase